MGPDMDQLLKVFPSLFFIFSYLVHHLSLDLFFFSVRSQRFLVLYQVVARNAGVLRSLRAASSKNRWAPLALSFVGRPARRLPHTQNPSIQKDYLDTWSLTYLLNSSVHHLFRLNVGIRNSKSTHNCSTCFATTLNLLSNDFSIFYFLDKKETN